MLNDFGNIPSENELRDLARVEPQELVVRDSAGDETPIGEAYGNGADTDEEPYDGGGWPGDGSGTDDLADFNQNEADDYSGE